MIDDGLVTAILGESSIATLLGAGNPVYAERLKKDTAFPAIVYSIDDEKPLSSFGSDAPTATPRSITLDIYAEQRSTLRQLDEAVKAFFHKFAGSIDGVQVTGCRVESVMRTWEEKTKLHRAIVPIRLIEGN